MSKFINTKVYTDNYGVNKVIRKLFIDISKYTGPLSLDKNHLYIAILAKNVSSTWGIQIADEKKNTVASFWTKETSIINKSSFGIYMYAELNYDNMDDGGFHGLPCAITNEAFNLTEDPRKSITEEKIADAAVTVEKIADAAVTVEKLANTHKNIPTSTMLQKCGFYCSNFNTGAITVATATRDGIVIPVLDDLKVFIVGTIPQYYGNHAAFYSGAPSKDTFISAIISFKGNSFMPARGTKYVVFTIKADVQFKAAIYQNLYMDNTFEGNLLVDSSLPITKVINPIFHAAPVGAQIVKEVYIAKEDIPADVKDKNDPYFALGQILYAFGTQHLNRIRIYYLTTEDKFNYKAFGEIETRDAEGKNATIYFGTSRKSYAVINFSELADLGFKKDSELFYTPNGEYRFINSKILSHQFSASSIPDGSIDDGKLKTDLPSLKVDLSDISEDLVTLEGRVTQIEENMSAPPAASDIELFSIGDSLFAGGTWQKKTAAALGIIFDQSKNEDPQFPLSIGGTSSDMSKIGTTYFRVRNLIEKGYIKNGGEKAIIILENVNDYTFTFNPADKVYRMEQKYALSALNQEQLNTIAKGNRVLNAVVGLKSLANGKKLIIDTLPVREGDVTIKTGWAAPGDSTYNIHVIPQSTDELTRKYVIDRIVEYQYKLLFDTAGDDGNSVYFTNGNSTYEIRVSFLDTGNTGMSCSIVAVENEAPWETFYWYIGTDIEDINWGNTSNWVKPTISSAWKSSIEELLRAYPKAHIFIANFPSVSLSAGSYFDSARGVYDEKRWYDDTKNRRDKHLLQFKAISDLYTIPLLDVWGSMNMSASNWDTFFPKSANVHPLSAGYEREGELIAAMLKQFLPIK